MGYAQHNTHNFSIRKKMIMREKSYIWQGKFFDKYSKEYDSQGRQESLCFQWVKNNVLDRVDRRGNVLDIAAGTGWLTFDIAKKHQSSLVVGVDISKKMLSVAKKKNIYNNVEFMVIPAESLPFRESSFDFITCIFAWEHVSDQKNVVKRIFELLKPEGKFLLGTNFKSDEKSDRMIEDHRKKNPLDADKWDDDWNKFIERIKEVSDEEYYTEHPMHFEPYYHEIIMHMKNAGFKNVEMLPTFHRVFGVFVGEKAFK